MHPKRQIRIGDPLVYKKLIKQITDTSLNINKVDQQMDRFVQNSDESRWKVIKRKYTIDSMNCSRRSSGVELDPQLILKIQAKQKSKNSSYTSVASIIKNSSTKSSKKNLSTKDDKFFSADKKSLHYLQKSSTAYIKLKTDQNEQKNKTNKNSWYSFMNKKRGNPRKQRFSKRFQHPALDIYKEAMDDVIKSSKQKGNFRKPFDWFANPYELDDF